MEQARNRVFGQLMKQLQQRYSLCLYDGSNCTSVAVKAHSIQNADVLDRLCKDGHVIMPQLVLTRNEAPKFVFKLVGRNNATVFTGLCADHDAELFRPIDTNEIDLENVEHLFLLSYRALLKEVHSSRKSAMDTQVTYQRGVEEGLYPKDTPSVPGEHAVEQMLSAWLVDLSRQEYERISQEKHYEDVQHSIIELDTDACLAVSSMFSTEIHSIESGKPCFVTLNIFPYMNRSIAIFSYLASESNYVAQAFESIFQAEGHYLLYEISKLVLRKCDNFVLAPDVFESFPEQQVAKLMEYFERNICGQVYQLEAPELFLFGPVE